MPLGIQRLPAGMLASASAPIAASRPLHSAIACTVPMWLCTAAALGDHQLGVVGLDHGEARPDGPEVRRLLGEQQREHPLAGGQGARLVPQREDLAHGTRDYRPVASPGVSERRGLVLGGGGVTGIAWETGLLLGLQEAGVDLTSADLVVGTSAGSVVGAQVTTGCSLAELYERQLQPPAPGAGHHRAAGAGRVRLADGARAGRPRGVRPAAGRVVGGPRGRRSHAAARRALRRDPGAAARARVAGGRPARRHRGRRRDRGAALLLRRRRRVPARCRHRELCGARRLPARAPRRPHLRRRRRPLRLERRPRGLLHPGRGPDPGGPRGGPDALGRPAPHRAAPRRGLPRRDLRRRDRPQRPRPRPPGRVRAGRPDAGGGGRRADHVPARPAHQGGAAGAGAPRADRAEQGAAAAPRRPARAGHRHRRQPRLPADDDARRSGGGHLGHRADPGRERDRQGAGGPRHPRALAAGARARSSR